MSASERTIPVVEPDPREAQRRNSAALRYLHQMAFLRTEPNKHHIVALLLGRDPEEHRG